MDTQRPEGAVTVWHGSYGEWTYYDIVRHCYGCTDCESVHQGYVEILEIKNAPFWRSKYVIHEYWNATGSTVYEFPSLQTAVAAYKKWNWMFGHEPPDRRTPALLSSLSYGQKRPWFYVEP